MKIFFHKFERFKAFEILPLFGTERILNKIVLLFKKIDKKRKLFVCFRRRNRWRVIKDEESGNEIGK